MLKEGSTYSYNPNYLDVKGNLVYAHLEDLDIDSGSVERLLCPEELEYVFQLIRSSFLYIDAYGDFLPARKYGDKAIHFVSFFIHSLPFKDDLRAAENGQWNDLVRLVSEDFAERKESTLRGTCTYEELVDLINYCLEDFDYPDRKRLDPVKLINLVVFVYDYCILTMREAHLHPDLDQYAEGEIIIRNKPYSAPIRVCASVAEYVKKHGQLEEDAWPEVGYRLPEVRLEPTIQNPHASDSNLSAMFVDLMHKFFLSFGLQKRGNTQWSKGEKMLVYELLRLFKLCKSSKPAAQSKYVTTVMNDYGDYFSSCNLRTWIRNEQAYSYLMCCSIDEFVRKNQKINLPFIPIDCFIEVEGGNDTSDDTTQLDEEIALEYGPTKVDDLPKDLRTPLEELSGVKCKVTHTAFERLCYATVVGNTFEGSETVTWDSRLDYVMDLIRSTFDYVTFLPVKSKYMVIRNDLRSPRIMSNLIRSLETDLLARLEMIPRGQFKLEEIRHIIENFHGFLPTREERARFDEEKFFILSLFIFDYVYVTYKEAAISAHLRLFNPSKLSICGKTHPSTVLIDDMLALYLEGLYVYARGDGENDLYELLADPDLFVPKDNYPIELESCTVKNMTAMFFDLFFHFFKYFGLSKRPDVKYVSDQESILIAELANRFGICVTDNIRTARTMFMTNRQYFENSYLALSIRENEYGYLMINTISEKLFGPK